MGIMSDKELTALPWVVPVPSGIAGLQVERPIDGIATLDALINTNEATRWAPTSIRPLR